MPEAPCCCMSLKTGVIVVATVNMVFDTLTVLENVLIVALSLSKRDDKSGGYFAYESDKEAAEAYWTVYIIVWSVLLVLSTGRIILDIVLFIGAYRRQRFKCQLWFFVTTAITVIVFIFFIVRCIYAGKGTGFIIGGFVIWLIIMAYQLWVVYALIQELKGTRRIQSFP